MNAHTSPLSDSLDSIRDSFSTISQLTASISLPPSPPSSADAQPNHANRRKSREMRDLPLRLSDLVDIGETGETFSCLLLSCAIRAHLHLQVGSHELTPFSSSLSSVTRWGVFTCRSQKRRRATMGASASGAGKVGPRRSRQGSQGALGRMLESDERGVGRPGRGLCMRTIFRVGEVEDEQTIGALV